jgi:hypothetical protein
MQISTVVLVTFGSVMACLGWAGCSESAECPVMALRFNPEVNTCTSFGSRADCDACDAPDERSNCFIADVDTLDYAECASTACFGLAEAACLTTTACRVVQLRGGIYGGCKDTAPSGALHDGGCAELDAYQCSRHDDCVALYDYPVGYYQRSRFLRCTDEPLAASRAGE